MRVTDIFTSASSERNRDPSQYDGPGFTPEGKAVALSVISKGRVGALQLRYEILGRPGAQKILAERLRAEASAGLTAALGQGATSGEVVSKYSPAQQAAGPNSEMMNADYPMPRPGQAATVDGTSTQPVYQANDWAGGGRDGLLNSAGAALGTMERLPVQNPGSLN